MEQPAYEPVEGIRATRVDGAESLFRQGEYYVAGGRLVIKCPNCRADNFCPPQTSFRAAGRIARLLGMDRGLTLQPVVCFMCRHGFRCAAGQISITKDPINA